MASSLLLDTAEVQAAKKDLEAWVEASDAAGAMMGNAAFGKLSGCEGLAGKLLVASCDRNNNRVVEETSSRCSDSFSTPV